MCVRGVAACSVPVHHREGHLFRRWYVRHGDAHVETVACLARSPNQCPPDGASVCLHLEENFPSWCESLAICTTSSTGYSMWCFAQCQTKWVCDDTGSYLMTHQIKSFLPYGGARVFLTKEEVASIKALGVDGQFVGVFFKHLLFWLVAISRLFCFVIMDMTFMHLCNSHQVCK